MVKLRREKIVFKLGTKFQHFVQRFARIDFVKTKSCCIPSVTEMPHKLTQIYKTIRSLSMNLILSSRNK